MKTFNLGDIDTSPLGRTGVFHVSTSMQHEEEGNSREGTGLERRLQQVT